MKRALLLPAVALLAACAPDFDRPDPADFSQCTESGQTCWGSLAPPAERPTITQNYLYHQGGLDLVWTARLPADFTYGDAEAVAILDEFGW